MEKKVAPGPRRISLLRLARNAARLIVVIVLIILAAEAVLQIGFRMIRGTWYPAARAEEYPPLYSRDERTGWRVCPNLNLPFITREFSTTINTDGRGFRKINSSGSGSPVLVIGDSFAFGWGVDAADTFVSLVSKSTGVPFQSHAVPGFGLVQEEILVEEALCGKKPTLVLLETWPLDWDIINSALMAELDHYLVNRETLQHYPRWLVSLRIALFNKSILCGFLEKTGKVITLMRGKTLFKGYGLNAFMAGEQPKIIREAREEAFSHIRRIKEKTDSLGIPLVIVVVPSVFQVYPEDLRGWIRAYGISGEADLERPNRELKEFASGEGILLIDLLEPFREYVRHGGSRLYYRTDPHWNPQGHSVASKAIEKFITSHHLLEKSGRAAKE